MQTKFAKPDLSLLIPLKENFEEILHSDIARKGKGTKLLDAIEYSLVNGGKRIRPLLVRIVADALGNGYDVSKACLSAEYFHTSSLIADDLPCMDNDDFRRDKPSLHKIFGEGVALLASYALISAGYEMIFESVQALAPHSDRAGEVCIIALEHASKSAGLAGATGGQFLDLYSKGRSLEDLEEVIYKKTITLFEVAILFGWIFGGGDLKKIHEVKEVGYHLGYAFQVADDLSDIDQDGQDGTNLAIALGKEKAHTLFEREMDLLESQAKKLGIFSSELQQVGEFMRWGLQ